MPDGREEQAGETMDVERSPDLHEKAPAEGGPGHAGAPPSERSGGNRGRSSVDVDALNEKIRAGQEEVEALRRELEELRGRQEEEIRAQRKAAEKEVEALRRELSETRNATKNLKSQNLNLQHHLNSWGISSSDRSVEEFELFAQTQKGHNRFFPPVVPLQRDVDPAPIVLRGDLSIFHLGSSLSFLESNSIVGVLTVVSAGTVTKMYTERGALRLVAWNKRDDDFGFTGLLLESEFLKPEEADAYREENMYDLEVANRLVWEGKLDSQTVRECLREHARVIISRLFHVESGAFFFQLGVPSCEKTLLFNLPITDFLLRTAARVDEESRSIAGLDELAGLDLMAEVPGEGDLRSEPGPELSGD